MITTPIIIYALAFFVKALIPLGFIVATIQYHTTQNLFRTYHFSSFSYPQTRITCYNPDMIMRTLQRYTSLAFAVLLLISLGVSNRIQTPATVEAAVPAGFTIKDIPSGQSEALTSFDSAPDQSFFTTGKNGRVAWVSPSGATTTLATLPVVTNQDLGLTSIAVAKDFVTSKKSLYCTDAICQRPMDNASEQLDRQWGTNSYRTDQRAGYSGASGQLRRPCHDRHSSCR